MPTRRPASIIRDARNFINRNGWCQRDIELERVVYQVTEPDEDGTFAAAWDVLRDLAERKHGKNCRELSADSDIKAMNEFLAEALDVSMGIERGLTL